MSLDRIRTNAQLALKHFRDVSGLGARFGYNLESVEWIDGFIERQRSSAGFTPDKKATLIRVIGSYLGECVIHTYGGAWRQHEGRWGVFFDDLNAVFPFVKVSKQFKNGSGDSVFSFFELIGLVILKRKEPSTG